MELRSKTLDVLRAVAILLVLGFHMEVIPYGPPWFLKNLVAIWATGGWAGVDLFFVLSGFLISGLLFNEHMKFGNISFKHFFIRRGFKIYPAFYTMIAVTLLVAVSQGSVVTWRALAPWCLFLQDYIITPISKVAWRHTWSLAVEEQFYIFLPILLIILYRTQKSKAQSFKLIPLIAGSIAVTCLVLRVLICVNVWPYNDMAHYYPFHLRIDSLFFGVLISYFYHYYPVKFKAVAGRFKELFFYLGIALFIPSFFIPREATIFAPVFEYLFLYLGSGLILISTIGTDLKPGIFTNTMAYVGRYSYSIYLWHVPILLWSIHKLYKMKHSSFGPYVNNWFTMAAVYLLGSILFGILISKLIEYPMLKLRDRLYPSRSKSPVKVEKDRYLSCNP